MIALSLFLLLHFLQEQTHTENPLDLSKSMTTITSRSSHLETNNKISATELRTSISSTASVVLRSKTTPQEIGKISSDTISTHSSSSHTSSLASNKSVITDYTPVIRPVSSLSNQSHNEDSTPKLSVTSLPESKYHIEKFELDPPLSKLATPTNDTFSKISHSNGKSFLFLLSHLTYAMFHHHTTAFFS